MPLRPSLCRTVHKFQGAKAPDLVGDMTDLRSLHAGMMYVVLSRVPSLQGVSLINFKPKLVHADERVIKEMAFLRSVVLSVVSLSTFTPVSLSSATTAIF